jgi:hypothetical protein
MATRLYQDEQDKYHLIGRPENPYNSSVFSEIQKGEVSIKLTPKLCDQFGLNRSKITSRLRLEKEVFRTIDIPEAVPEIPIQPLPEIPLRPQPEIPLYPRPKTPTGPDFEV